MKPTADKRSPIRRSPVRVAGQSLDGEIHKYLEDKAYPTVMLAVLMTTVAAMEWWRWYREVPPQPVPATVLAVIAWIWFFLWLPRHRKRLRAMRQGLDGERAVAEYLDRFRERGYHVFHDVVGESFNIDHVLVGPTGLYTIETKTISKPAKGSPRVMFEGETLRVGGHKPDRDPIVQAKAQASWLAELLGKPGGRKVTVQPVVFFPGWWIDPLPKGFPVWVLEPKALEGFLAHQPAKLSTEDVKTLAWQVKQYVGLRE
ncbi:MAG: nuclease-related domain-containing protein [Deferrisomatales bacterium]|nr:nuclease-related domain-containing protein [Deferrisomatales bacterium]